MRRHRNKRWCVFVAGLLVIPPVQGFAFSREEAQQTAHLLASLLDAGRVVIDRNQPLIDDPHKGDKGFTPDVFEAQVVQEFKARTGIDLSRPGSSTITSSAKELLLGLLEASKEVVADAQLVINQRGVGYKNFIPATFGSQAAFRFSQRSPVQLKQTALRPRNLKNTPDEHETEILERLAKQPVPASPVSELVEGGTALRLIDPIYYEKECLKCHGEPAGEEDISGYPKEGRHEGELAGAISVTIPLTMP